MKRIILISLLLSMFLTPATMPQVQASLVSSKNYRSEQKKEIRQDIKQIKNLMELHNKAANLHDVSMLKVFYADNYVNNDGFNKEIYFKSIEDTWKDCSDLTYSTKIISIDVDGEHGSVNVEETASGTITETFDNVPVSGEIHSKSYGIYHLVKLNGSWYISGETALTDESSLLYGDARFMNIEIQAPSQVGAGEAYTTTLKIDTDENTFVMGSIDSDPVKYPSKSPKNTLRAINDSGILERYFKANSDNLNEYVVASLAISKVQNRNTEGFKIYMAGLACVMKRVNVVPKNNYIKIED
jgi:hypothetical protein